MLCAVVQDDLPEVLLSEMEFYVRRVHVGPGGQMLDHRLRREALEKVLAGESLLDVRVHSLVNAPDGVSINQIFFPKQPPHVLQAPQAVHHIAHGDLAPVLQGTLPAGQDKKSAVVSSTSARSTRMAVSGSVSPV